MELTQVKDLTANLWQLRLQKDTVKNELEGIQSRIDEVERQLIETLDAAGMERFDGDDCTVYLQEKSSVKVPKDPDSKREFLYYLKHRGDDLFESMVTVNAQTLNAWYREQEQLAAEMGELEFNVPGLGEPSRYQQLSVRKRR